MPAQKTTPDIIVAEKQIVKNLVGLANIDEIVLIDRGWDSRVYALKSENYFFKFPRSAKIQSHYKFEIAGIKSVANMGAAVRVQKILWEHPKNAYFGYEGVQGLPLSVVAQDLNDSEQQIVGMAVGNFLKFLHQLKLPSARTVSVADEAKQIQRWYVESLSVIAQVFTEGEQQKLHELVYEIWPINLERLGSESVLCHGDLHFENILYSKDRGIGIIDFGDVGYYDRSKDFLELNDQPVIFDSALQTYGQKDAKLMEKIALRRAMIQIINLGFFLGKNDKAGIARTVDKIKASLMVDPWDN